MKVENNGLFSKDFTDFAKFFNKEVSSHYTGNCIVTYTFNGETKKEKSDKWAHIERKGKKFTLSPEVYSNKLKSINHFIYFKNEKNEITFGSIQKIFISNEGLTQRCLMIKVGSVLKTEKDEVEFNNPLHSLVSFSNDCISLPLEQVEGKAICNSFDDGKTFYCSKFIS